MHKVNEELLQYFKNVYMERLDNLKASVHSTIFQDSMLIKPEPVALANFLIDKMKRFTEQTVSDCTPFLHNDKGTVPHECFEKVTMKYILDYVQHERFSKIIIYAFNIATENN